MLEDGHGKLALNARLKVELSVKIHRNLESMCEGAKEHLNKK